MSEAVWLVQRLHGLILLYWKMQNDTNCMTTSGYSSLLNLRQFQIKYIRRIEAAGRHWICKDRIPIFLVCNFVGLSPDSILFSHFKSRSALLPWEGYSCVVCMWYFCGYLVALKLVNQLWKGWLAVYVWGVFGTESKHLLSLSLPWSSGRSLSLSLSFPKTRNLVWSWSSVWHCQHIYQSIVGDWLHSWVCRAQKCRAVC